MNQKNTDCPVCPAKGAEPCAITGRGKVGEIRERPHFYRGIGQEPQYVMVRVPRNCGGIR